MSDNRLDRVSISREALTGRPAGVAPSWIPPVLKRFYDFTKKWAKAFNGELKQDREEELVKAVAKSFKGEV
jgi:hypothetical protein